MSAQASPAPIAPIESPVGWADYGDFEHHGLRLYRDLLGRTSFLGLAVFAMTGRRLSPEDVAVLDDLAVCTLCPDPRIWPAKLTRLAASAGSFVPGMIAGWSAIESRVGMTLGEVATDLLVGLGDHPLAEREDAGLALLDQPARLRGFVGVHLHQTDERVPALTRALEARGRTGGRYWTVATSFWALAERTKQMSPGYWGAATAALLDLGFTRAEIGPMFALLFMPAYFCMAMDGARLTSPSLQRLPADRVKYVGAPPRESPRAVAARRANEGGSR